MIDAKEVRRLLDYNPSTGVFTRLVRTSRRINVGDITGCPNEKGYLLISLQNRLYRAHRLAWLYVHGEWPPAEIDHIDGNRSNNAISNLRPSTHAQNMQNLAKKSSNSSGATGVHWARNRSKWKAEIGANGSVVRLGSFSSKEEARNAYLAAKAKLHLLTPVPREEAVR